MKYVIHKTPFPSTTFKLFRKQITIKLKVFWGSDILTSKIISNFSFLLKNFNDFQEPCIYYKRETYCGEEIESETIQSMLLRIFRRNERIIVTMENNDNE